MDDVTTVLNASRPSDLFGANRKQARIIYLNLMRSVHPDLHPGDSRAESATKRLSELWGTYLKGRDDDATSSHTATSSSAPKKRPIELTRNDRYVLFDEGGRLLLVNRDCHNASSLPDEDAINGIKGDLDGSPVMMMTNIDSLLIAQKDGNHKAHHVTCDSCDVSDGIYFMDDLLEHHLPSPYLEPEDAVWLMKRVVFLSGVLDKHGIMLPEGTTPLIVPSTHAMIVPEPCDIESIGTSMPKWRNETLGIIEGHMHVYDGSDARQRVTAQFIEGVKYMMDPATILRWTDDFAARTFGGIAFHRMQTI